MPGKGFPDPPSSRGLEGRGDLPLESIIPNPDNPLHYELFFLNK